MSKVIVHNRSGGTVTDTNALLLVMEVLKGGFVSGDNQYCWVTTFTQLNAAVVAERSRGTTYTFKVLYYDVDEAHIYARDVHR